MVWLTFLVHKPSFISWKGRAPTILFASKKKLRGVDNTSNGVAGPQIDFPMMLIQTNFPGIELAIH